jgi:hypothetical protein
VQVVDYLSQQTYLHALVEEIIGTISSTAILIDGICAVGEYNDMTGWSFFLQGGNQVDARATREVQVEYRNIRRTALGNVSSFTESGRREYHIIVLVFCQQLADTLSDAGIRIDNKRGKWFIQSSWVNGYKAIQSAGFKM